MVDDLWVRLAQVGDKKVAFSTGPYADLPVALQRRLARRAISHLSGTLQNITFAHIEAARRILEGDANSPPSKHLPHNLQAARRGQTSSISRRRAVSPDYVPFSQERPLVPSDWQAPCDIGGEIVLESTWSLEIASIMPPLPDARNLDNGNLTAIFDLDALETLRPLVWRTRQPGDFMHPMGMSGHKSLQDSMVDAKIPSEQRDHVPILAQTQGREVLWIPGVGGRRSMHAPITDDTKQALLLRWTTA
jgi:tRNA(Ile)-lysidine synthase